MLSSWYMVDTNSSKTTQASPVCQALPDTALINPLNLGDGILLASFSYEAVKHQGVRWFTPGHAGSSCAAGQGQVQAVWLQSCACSFVFLVPEGRQCIESRNELDHI